VVTGGSYADPAWITSLSFSKLTAGTVKANSLQAAPSDLGAGNVTVDFSNSNGSFVTNVTTDGTITSTAGFHGNLTGNADTVTNGLYQDGSGNVTISGNLTLSGVIAGKVLHYNVFACPIPATEWAPAEIGVTLPVSKSASICYLRMSGLKTGEIIKSYLLKGAYTSTSSGNLTLDAAIYRVAGNGTITTIGSGSISQVTANTTGNISSTCDNTDETVVSDSEYYLKITGTTGANCTISIVGVEATVDCK
jgi:hypothetical protein